MRSRHFRFPSRQDGSFVIEALISALLFAIGLVAMIMIAAQGTGQVGQSRYRSEASFLAGELIGEMWVSAQSPVAHDRTAWNARVAAALPGGDGTGTTISGTQVSVNIAWDDTKQSGVQHHYITTAEIVK